MSTHRCPVCDMEVISSEIAAEHYGVSYLFCSEQCKENFICRPSLYVGNKSQKKLGKQEIKKRTFVLDKVVSNSDKQALESMLTAMMGVQEVQVFGAKVSISYDLLEATATQIEKEIEQAGAKLGSGWAEKLKRGWIHYTEENALDNLAANERPCCNKPPARG